MYTFETQVRVRYGETDQMGYVYYGRYAEYYEVGRVETIRSLGVSYKSLESEHGIWLPVVSLEIRYLRPAKYDDLLTIRTSIREFPDTHITFHVEVLNEKGKLLNSGRVRLCFLDAASGKVVDMPAVVASPLRGYF
jgi:acyl-CoA thioester hydrolase